MDVLCHRKRKSSVLICLFSEASLNPYSVLGPPKDVGNLEMNEICSLLTGSLTPVKINPNNHRFSVLMEGIAVL